MKEILIANNPHVPLQCCRTDIVPCAQQWFHVLRIFFVLNGNLHIQVGSKRYLLSDDDLILVNPYEVFSVPDGNGTMITCDIDLREIHEHLALPQETHFTCCSVTASDQQPIVVLRSLIAQFIRLNTIIPIETTYLNISFFYSILHHLISYCIQPEDANVPDTKQFQRMEAIARFIDENCNNPHLSLQDVANHFFLSAPYTSKIIRKYFGSTFTDFIKAARLQKALPRLLEDGLSIDFTAESSGFPNARSFIAAFKMRYGTTPGQYRKLYLDKKNGSHSPDLDGLDFEQRDDLKLLTKYLDETGNPITITSPPRKAVQLPAVNVLQKGTRLQHTWRKMTSVSSARDLLTAECRQALQRLQREVGFDYIYFHGLLDDSIMLCSEDSTGAISLNFVIVDLIIDFLCSINLRPFLELSFMPTAPVQSDPRFTDHSKPVILMPQYMTQWKQIVEDLIRHLQLRYGMDEVSHWPVSAWIVPDGNPLPFDWGSIETYFSFYRETWRTVKACDPSIEVGVPPILATVKLGALIEKFSQLCRQDNCPPDFWQYHYFPTQSPFLPANTQSVPSTAPAYRPGEDDLRMGIAKVKENLQKGLVENSRLYISKWGLSNTRRELLSDTVFLSAYIVKNILENYDSVSAFCYWNAIDVMDKMGNTSELYHGGWGLFSYNAIPKASYYAMTLLAKLGDTKLADGPGYFVTRRGARIQILLYNYQHFSPLCGSGESFDMTLTNRYAPFREAKEKLFVIPLSGLSDKEYTITESTINTSHGSSYDQWLSLGGLPLESLAEVEYLRQTSVPFIQKRREKASKEGLTLHCALSVHEVRLIEVIPYG